MEGISTLFEDAQNHLEQKDVAVEASEPKETSPNYTKCIEKKSQSIIPSSHFKDRVEHETLLASVDCLIDRHYTNKGFGKFYEVFQKRFPDACHIM